MGNKSHQKSQNNLSTPTIIGGVGGGQAAILVAIVAIYCYIRRKVTNNFNVTPPDDEDEDNDATFYTSYKRNSTALLIGNHNGNPMAAHSQEYAAISLKFVGNKTPISLENEKV